ncbi:signal transduction histidine kinase [Frigoribacterium sp. PhB160]|nr:signal transduction histidine kinase [Frigoribacterium sp. PhB160]
MVTVQTTRPAATVRRATPGPVAWPRTPRREAWRLGVIALVGAAYFASLALALRLEWYPQALPGYLYLGVVALVGAATVERWPVETLVNVTAFTAYTTIAPLPPALYGLYVGPPEGLVPLAVVAFLLISGRGPIVASAATFGTLAVLVVLPWRDIAAAGVDGAPLTRALLLDTGQDRSILVGQFVACGLVVLVAVLLRRQREATAELAEKNSELLELRAGEVARIAEQERTRIARDVHDEVAHHVAALVIRAQAALRVADQRPDQLVPAMREIAEGGQDVLGRIRGVVRMLKAAPAGGGSAPTTVADELDRHVGRLRSIGYAVESDVSLGDDVPSPQREAVLGVVQESLTNAMLHSSAHEVRLAVRQGESGWTVLVSDPGPARERFPDMPRGGSGLPSMRDRVSALGGTLTSGPGQDGTGWSVTAELPHDDRVADAPRARRAGRSLVGRVRGRTA